MTTTNDATNESSESQFQGIADDATSIDQVVDRIRKACRDRDMTNAYRVSEIEAAIRRIEFNVRMMKESLACVAPDAAH